MKSTTAPTRRYTMKSRARAVQATRDRILDACLEMHGERPVADISLDDIASRAQVSVQTVLRHFGSRAGLVEASFERAQQAVADERRTPVGDVSAAVRTIVDHYEQRGDHVLLMLDQERQEELMRRVTEHGRALHRAWVEDVFGPLVAGREGRPELTDLLVVATDVYTWKLLRRDRGLSRQHTERRMRRLVDAVLSSEPPT